MKKYPLSVLLVVIICVLSLLPAQEFPESDVPFADKWVHWLMYGTLSFVFLWENRRFHRSDPQCTGIFSPTALLLLSLAVAWGGLMELAQAYLTTTRSGDWLDFAANSFGVLCGSVIFVAVCAAMSRRA